MEYEVEFTDEFGEWWDGLSVAEQVSIEAVVDLLVEHGPRWVIRTAPAFMDPGTAICGSCGFSIKEGRIASCMRLIRGGRRCC